MYLKPLSDEAAASSDPAVEYYRTTWYTVRQTAKLQIEKSSSFPSSSTVLPGRLPKARVRAVAVGSGLDDLAPSTIVAWANVNADGALSAQRNVVQKARHRVGIYEVVFKKKSLKNCTHTATLATSATIAVSPGTQANSLRVEVRNYRGAAAHPFRPRR